LEQGKSEEALKAVRSAVSNSAKSQQPMMRISVAITVARVRAASYTYSSSPVQRAAQVIRDLRTLTNEAKKSGFMGLEFEARLAGAEVQLGSGKTRDGVAQLASLAEETNARGFGLIATKALVARK
jgi:hypothetical protein